MYRSHILLFVRNVIDLVVIVTVGVWVTWTQLVAIL